ncbi:MAG: hypothetical protein RL077_345 [Verrucomicrobiota bacterium]|jgi:hypothetical protein
MNENEKIPARYCADIETLGTSADAVIFEIGVVKFGHGGIYARFRQEVSIADCILRGMKEDADTAEWWAKQSPEARATLVRCRGNGGVNLDLALAELRDWFERHGEPDEVWGNGPAFDNRLLDEAFRRCGMRMPWKYRADRCLRTAKHYLPKVRVEFEGVRHRALDDAEHEAMEILAMEAAQRAKESGLRAQMPALPVASEPVRIIPSADWGAE